VERGGAAGVFCYGTLEDPERMRAITGRVFAAEPAVLDGFARYRVRGRPYPGAVPEAGAQSRGTLYRGVDAASLASLDRYEGDAYERHLVRVHTAVGERSAWVWLLRPERAHELSGEPWDRDAFLAGLRGSG
jgi:gamma-glutamylcyclotransferase (GGCT)/AIG2-like uncharacterized protein YtfP